MAAAARDGQHGRGLRGLTVLPLRLMLRLAALPAAGIRKDSAQVAAAAAGGLQRHVDAMVGSGRNGPGVDVHVRLRVTLSEVRRVVARELHGEAGGGGGEGGQLGGQFGCLLGGHDAHGC